jgi:hypothetical protein
MRYLIALLLLASCAKDPVATGRTDNPEIDVGTLFDHEGCRVYRFHDGDRSVYYAKCYASSETAWSESCGKNCHRQVNVPTGGAP